MALFELIKNPELAEQTVEEPLEPEPEDDSPFPVEIQKLRKRAEETDDRISPTLALPNPMELPLGRQFLPKCMSAARKAATQPINAQLSLHYSDTRYGNISRVVRVPLLSGDWLTVLAGREAAIATVEELRRRGYASPSHRFECEAWREGQWTLSITFGF